MLKRKIKFKKIYVLDTNIILNDIENMFILSNNGENLIVLPETVLDELDSKKSGFEEINYQAREFGRIYSDAEVLQVDKGSVKKNSTISSRIFKNDKVLYIDVQAKKKYLTDTDTTIPANIRNDRKIIEIARDIQTENNNTVFVSLDVMARNRALTLGLDVQAINTNSDKPLVLKAELIIDEPQLTYDIFDVFKMDVPETVQHIQITDKCGKPFFYYRTGNQFRQIDEAELIKQNIRPQNMGQKVLSSQMLDESFDVVLSNSAAGSGKTLIALSAAMRLLDVHKSKYDKIIYIRKNILSGEDLGFMKGDLAEKMSGFLAPLHSNVEFIVQKKFSQNKKTKLTKEEMDTKVEELMDRYQIQFKYDGHLRGDNIRKAIIIWDEGQNNEIPSAKTILTRVSEDCRVFVLGSTKQIDNKFLNIHNNALTFLMNKIGKDNMNVNVTGFNLDKTVRSSIAEWADNF